MPRQGRLDFPGALQHVMVRGQERRRLFRDRKDYQEFKNRLGSRLVERGFGCYAWALMPNHIHLLIRTGGKPLFKMMQSLLAGYGQYFNGRYHRHGYVYGGRYKSVLCQEEKYFLVLLRYIHLNPLKARVVKGLRELRSYPWTGHKALMGKEKLVWQDTESVLDRFGRGLQAQRKEYLKYLRGNLGSDFGLQLAGGSLIRALVGRWEETEVRKGRRLVGDERILGDERFIEKMLEKAEEDEDRRQRLKRTGWTLPRVVARAAKAMDLKPGDVRGPSKEPRRSRARALASKWAVEDLGLTTVTVSRYLRVTQPAVTGAVHRGRTLEKELHVRLETKSKRRRRIL